MPTTLQTHNIVFNNGRSTGVDLGDSRFIAAYVSFPGDAPSPGGTLPIYDSFNVSSVVDLGIGSYRVVFSNSIGGSSTLGNVDYTVLVTAGYSGFGLGASNICIRRDLSNKEYVTFNTGYLAPSGTSTTFDPSFVSVAIAYKNFHMHIY